MHLPHRWGPGTIFALSGLEATTDRLQPFLAAPEEAQLGLVFRLRTPLSLRFVGDWPLTPADLDEDRSVCANELLDLALPNCGRIVLVPADKWTFAGRARGARPVLVGGDGAVAERFGGEDGHVALAVDGERFAVGYSPTSEADAVARARAGLACDVEAIAARYRAWLENLPVPAGLDEWQERTFRKACAILRVNIESPQGLIPCRWTTPDRWPHRNMWLWDSAFHAIGLLHLDLAMAEEAILAKVAMLGEDGYLAHMSGPTPDLFSKDCTQPPILGWAAERVFAVTGRREFAAQLVEPLQRYLAWNRTHRAAPGDGELLGWRVGTNNDPIRGARGGESGWDNSPRFDRCTGLAAVDFSCQAQRELEAVAHFAEVVGQRDVAAVHRDQAAALAGRINARLWHTERGFYFDRDQDGAWIPVLAGSGFTPLWSGTASAEQAATLVRHLNDERTFARPLPVPSLAASEPTCCDDMWRGPTWLNYDLLIAEGLRRYGYRDEAALIRERLLAEVARWYRADGTLYEYYDAEATVSPARLHRKGGVGSAGGVGFGVIRDYNWSAAVFVDLARTAF